MFLKKEREKKNTLQNKNISCKKEKDFWKTNVSISVLRKS